MPEARDPEARDHPVFDYFRKKDPKTGKSVHYDPAGPDGWPGAKSVFVGVPGSDEVLELQAGAVLSVAEGTHGPPLIGQAIEPEPESKPSTRRTAKES